MFMFKVIVDDLNINLSLCILFNEVTKISDLIVMFKLGF